MLVCLDGSLVMDLMFAFGCFMLCASFLIGFKNFGKKGERKEESLTKDQVDVQ